MVHKYYLRIFLKFVFSYYEMGRVFLLFNPFIFLSFSAILCSCRAGTCVAVACARRRWRSVRCAGDRLSSGSDSDRDHHTAPGYSKTPLEECPLCRGQIILAGQTQIGITTLLRDIARPR